MIAPVVIFPYGPAPIEYGREHRQLNRPIAGVRPKKYNPEAVDWDFTERNITADSDIISFHANGEPVFINVSDIAYVLVTQNIVNHEVPYSVDAYHSARLSANDFAQLL